MPLSLREMVQYQQGTGNNRHNDPEGFNKWVAEQKAATAPTTPAMPSAPTAFQQSLTPQPFAPMGTPPMLPMQAGMSGQMPATKGAGKGPMSQQMPTQASPMMGPQTAGAGKPTDLNTLIQGLMSSGLLGGL
jgi:hypothetical protein